MKALLKVVLVTLSTLTITMGISTLIYRAGWFYHPIQHPLGFKVYLTIRHTFGAVGSEEAEELMMYFILGCSFMITTLLIWASFYLTRQYRKRKTK